MKKQFHRAIAVAMLLIAIFQSHLVSASDGTGVITVTANGGTCIGFTPAVGNGPDNWEVAEGGSYTMTITGVTECSGNAITIFVQNSSSGNFCFNATGGSGTYAGTFTVPNPTCNTMPVSYKCGADQPCNNANTYNANGQSNNHKVHLRASVFSGACVKTGDDQNCVAECICVAPSNLTIDSISAAEGLLCWDAVNCASSYIIAWRTQPKIQWLYSTVAAPAHCLIFTNHFDDVNEIQIATVCVNGDTSDYSPISVFQTFASCLAPQNPYTDGITSTKATLHWSPVSDASRYAIRYRNTNEITWIGKSISAPETSITIKNLLPSTTYQWDVQSKCFGTTRSVGGPISVMQHFTTSALKLEHLVETTPTSVSLYPDPASDQVVIDVKADMNTTKTMSVEIVNMLGQVIYATQPQAFDGSLKKQIDLRGIVNGFYTAHVTIDGKEFFNQLLIQH